MRLALVTDGVVTNVIVGDAADFPEAVEIVEGTPVARGWLYDGTDFTAPEPPAPEPQRIFTRYGFLNRLTMDEQVAIEMAIEKEHPSLNLNGQERATLRVFNRMIGTAQEVDLEDPNTIQGIQFLEAIGLIATGRADEVLDVQ